MVLNRPLKRHLLISSECWNKMTVLSCSSSGGKVHARWLKFFHGSVRRGSQVLTWKTINLVLYCCVKTIIKSLREKIVYLAYSFQSIIEDSQGKNWSRIHRGILLTGLPSSLSYITQDHSGAKRSPPPHQSLISSSETCPKAILMDAIPQLRFSHSSWL